MSAPPASCREAAERAAHTTSAAATMKVLLLCGVVLLPSIGRSEADVVPIGDIPFRSVPGCGQAADVSECLAKVLRVQLEKGKRKLAKEIRMRGNGKGFDPIRELTFPELKGPGGITLLISNVTLYGLSSIHLTKARVNGEKVEITLGLEQMPARGSLSIKGILGLPASGSFSIILNDLVVNGSCSVTFDEAGKALVDNVEINISLGNVELKVEGAGFIGTVFETYVTGSQDALKSRFFPPLAKRLAELVKSSLSHALNRSRVLKTILQSRKLSV